jgi:protein AFG1
MNSLASTNRRQGYPWSQRDEAKSQAITKGWRSVFAGGRDMADPALKREFVLACIARDLIEGEGWLLAFDEVQLVCVCFHRSVGV